MTMESLTALYVDQIRNLHSARTKVVLALPLLATSISRHDVSTVLRDVVALSDHHAERLEAILHSMVAPPGRHAEEFATLIGQGYRYVASWQSGASRDVAILTFVRTLLHLSIPEYDTARALAQRVGREQHRTEFVALLGETQAADEMVGRIIESVLEEGAVHAGG